MARPSEYAANEQPSWSDGRGVRLLARTCGAFAQFSPEWDASMDAFASGSVSSLALARWNTLARYTGLRTEPSRARCSSRALLIWWERAPATVLSRDPVSIRSGGPLTGAVRPQRADHASPRSIGTTQAFQPDSVDSCVAGRGCRYAPLRFQRAAPRFSASPAFDRALDGPRLLATLLIPIRAPR